MSTLDVSMDEMNTSDDNTDKTATKKENVSICANCGKEGDDLKSCTACKMVKYCNRECQIAHRPQHKKECRKRLAELHDEKLFKQPPPEEDCPICFTQIPTLETGSQYMTCCGKLICSGCSHAPVYDNQGNKVEEKTCPFCRIPIQSSYEEAMEGEKKRVDLGDPIAICNHGNNYRDGSYGFPQDHTKALELWHRAGVLGYADAYLNIGYAYQFGRGVEVDKKKAKHYWELAAIGGNIVARHNLGFMEMEAGNMDRVVRHYMIATRGGYSNSLNNIKELYSEGDATKEDYMKALKLYQEYLGEIKNPQRDEAAAAREDYRYF